MAGRWFSTGTSVSYTNKTFRRDITEIHVLLKVNITLNARHFGTGAIKIAKIITIYYGFSYSVTSKSCEI
jgi:hypothetical protein